VLPLDRESHRYWRLGQFDEFRSGNGNIALRAHANGKYVCADNAGAASLIANRTTVGPGKLRADSQR